MIHRLACLSVAEVYIKDKKLAENIFLSIKTPFKWPDINNDVEKHLNVMYDSLDTYTPDKIKHELKNLFRRQFKCFNESDFMSVLDDNNKKTFRDYCELCETTNVA